MGLNHGDAREIREIVREEIHAALSGTSQTLGSVPDVLDSVCALYKDMLHGGRFYQHMVSSRDRLAMLELAQSLHRQGWTKKEQN